MAGFRPAVKPRDYLLAGFGFGCGFLPFDSFFLSLLPMIFPYMDFFMALRDYEIRSSQRAQILDWFGSDTI